MTEPNRQKRMLKALCALLVLICACAAMAPHDHDCLHVVCAVCVVREIIACALVMACTGRLMAWLSNHMHPEPCCLPPTEGSGTLVQLKVKLSN